MTGAALIVQGDALRLPLPDASVDMICTSPPFWALRAFSAGPGEIGSEPTPQAFLEALWAATAEMKRVLKPSGSIFVDLGDKYCSGTSSPRSNISAPPGYGNGKNFSPTDMRISAAQAGVPVKSLLLLPERYRIGCVDTTSPYYRAQFYQQLANDLMTYEIGPERARQLADEFEASPKSKGLGLIARAVIVWDKPNGLPESVTDRVRKSHEDWVHLVKQPRYYSALDEVREPQQSAGERHEGRSGYVNADGPGSEGIARSFTTRALNPLGKLPGSVWTIPSEPLRLPEHLGVQHYAAFPSEWPRRLILGFSPPGICVDCNQGRVPVVDKRIQETRDKATRSARDLAGGDASAGTNWQQGLGVYGHYEATILGYACSCTPYTDHPGTGEGQWAQDERADRRLLEMRAKGESNRPAMNHLEDYRRVGPWREYHLDGWKPPPTRPAVILDPFGGTGTTAMVARALGRIGVSVDLSRSYSRAARWRVRHDGAKAISRTNLERQGMLL